MASIYGPPPDKRPRKRAREPGTVKTTPMQRFWLVIALIVFVAVMIHLDEGDPEIEDTLRELQRIQLMNEAYRPLDPAIFEIPKFEPPSFEPLQVAEIIAAPSPPATQAKPPPSAKTRRRPPRPAPAQ